MQYTLTIKSSENKTVMELFYDLYSIARAVSDGLERGYSESGEYFISIYDNWEKRVVYSAMTKARWQIIKLRSKHHAVHTTNSHI